MSPQYRTAIKTKTSQILRNMTDRPGNLWSDHPSIDLVLAGVVVGCHAFIVYQRHVGDVLRWGDQEQRLAVYAAGAGIMALIAGFTGTAIAQYGSSSGPVVTALRSTHGSAIRRNWLNISRWLLFGSVLCIVAMSIDTNSSTRSSQWVFEFALAMAIVKFVRINFLFGLIMSAVDDVPDESDKSRRLTPLSAEERARVHGVASRTAPPTQP